MWRSSARARNSAALSPRVGVHAHVERAVEAEAEAALGVVDLRRRDAEVEQHAVDLRDAERGERRRHRRERGVVDREARIGGERGVGRGAGDRLRVAVERDQAALRRQPLEDRARVAAAAERAVDIDAVGIGDERIDRFVQQNGQVLQGEARREIRS